MSVIVAKGPGVDRARRLDKYRGRVTELPLPGWVADVHGHQARAVDEIVREFETADVVMLDAPVGSGKTLVAEATRRVLGIDRALFVCTTRSLQSQVIRDFPYARELKGRANYTPTRISSGPRARGYADDRLPGRDAFTITCADCDAGPGGCPPDEQTCSYCEFVEDCPYTTARTEAMRAPLGVLNTAYLLAEANSRERGGRFSGRELVIADEADTLEQQLMGYVELRLGSRLLTDMGLEVPKKGSHMTTIRAWLEEEVATALVARARELANRKLDVADRRTLTRIERQMGDVARVVSREDGWVRDGDEEGRDVGLVLKPVSVEDVAGRYLWRHGEKWLLMSGTILSAETMADELGIEDAGLKWSSVAVPAIFPVENRRVTFVPVAQMTRKAQEAGDEVGRLVRGVNRVLEKHPGVNVLVHSHTYKLAREISAGIEDTRPVITYEQARSREIALDAFKARARKGGAVLVAASMDRGVDLPGDLCRVMVVCKVPYASLGSRQVSERLRTRGGQTWYLCETVRTLLQMTGRGVRSVDDWAETYVLDESFGKLLREGKRLGLWPEWWLEGLTVGRVREYV